MIKRLAILCLINVSCFATSFALGESIDVKDEKEMFELILENREYCTVSVADGKIYLKSDKIEPSNEGSFLWIDHFSLVQLPPIHSDEKGLYINLL